MGGATSATDMSIRDAGEAPATIGSGAGRARAARRHPKRESVTKVMADMRPRLAAEARLAEPAISGEPERFSDALLTIGSPPSGLARAG